MTQDSENFQVTFDYEFLEDFREKQTQGVHIHSKAFSRRSRQQDGWSYREALIERDEVDGGVIQSVIQRAVNALDPNMDNYWGPEGFTKQNHPLNIIVCVK